jgi:hypothetical protein
MDEALQVRSDGYSVFDPLNRFRENQSALESPLEDLYIPYQCGFLMRSITRLFEKVIDSFPSIFSKVGRNH